MMRLSHCTHATVFHVAANMRAVDKEEIYGLRWEENPFVITQEVMAQSMFAWVAWDGETPCAVIGGAPTHPGVWQMFMFATDSFPRIALGLTKFVLRGMLPQLWGELNAHRLEADSHEKHTEAHRWLERLGAYLESRKQDYGRDRADYRHYVLLKPVDRQNQQA